ncbi:MAG: hypothetical protein SF339_06615 [Blastocatellia bacterium]|nr:hypothetical protein [Blastocatellia bacterium]
MDGKEWLNLIGIIVTLCLGLYNFYIGQKSARRSSVVGAVTAQRIKWGAEIQELVASFCGAAHYWRFSTVKHSDEERKKIEEIDRLRHLIALKLCERSGIELEIENLVGEIVSMSSQFKDVTDDDFRNALNQLVRKTQEMLRKNWDSITYEAQNGMLASPNLPGLPTLNKERQGK